MILKSYFKEGEDINILNTQYVRGKDENDKWEDILYITYRDNKTKQKKLKTIRHPESTIFFTREDLRNSFNTQRLYLPLEDTISETVPYSSIKRIIARRIEEDKTDADILQYAKEDPRRVFKWRHSYFADYDINDYVFMSHALNNLDHVSDTTVSTAYLDIESDVFKLTNREINEGAAPINAVSVVIPYDADGNKLENPRVFTLLLRNHDKYEEQRYFENHMDKFIKECHNEFDKKYDSPKFVIRVYDDEIIMLKNLFALLHALRPDFILIWNMSYDIPAIIKRLEYLGENPTDYFCHPDFERPDYRYIYDLVYKNDFKNKSESFPCTCYSQFADQMLNYAGIRKSVNDYGGNGLDNVAHIELGAEKRKFNSPRTNVTNAAIREYWNFVKYNINDVLLQYGIDKKTGDTQALFEQAIYGGTRFHKALKQSVYLKNVWAIEYFKLGIVPRNNKNYDNSHNSIEADPDAIALAGAVVGDPIFNTHNGVYLNGEPGLNDKPEALSELKSNHLFEYVIDFDFKAMYPNAKITANIAEHTQYGRLILPKKILENENPLGESKFMRATKFIEDYETGDPIIIGAWLHLVNTETAIKLYNKKYHSDDNKKYAHDGRIRIRSRRSYAA